MISTGKLAGKLPVYAYITILRLRRRRHALCRHVCGRPSRCALSPTTLSLCSVQ